MDKKEYAVQLKHAGHNCAQAVLCAFTDETGISEEELMKLYQHVLLKEYCDLKKLSFLRP